MCAWLIDRDQVRPAPFESGYHHHKTQWFHNGKIIGGTSGSGLVYGSDQREKSSSSGKRENDFSCMCTDD